jgi:hypothetical protein
VALLYSLAIECGTRAAADACAEHFAGAGADVTVQQGPDDDAWWAVVIPANESRSGVYSEEVAESLNTAGRALLDRLRSAPPFRFALIGIEVDGSLTYDVLDEAFGSDPELADRHHGLVASDAVVAKLGAPAALEPFAPGYSWIPYRGERYGR